MVRKLGWVFFLAGLALAQSFWAETTLGRAEGRVEGGAIAFYGLPYAEAGRFQAPRPLKAWPEGVGQEAVACPQVPGITERFGGPSPRRGRTAWSSTSTSPPRCRLPRAFR